MKVRRTLQELNQECEEYMSLMEANKEACFAIYDTIFKTVDECLEKKEYTGILNLLPYFEDRKAYPEFQLSGETRKVYLLIFMLKSELKHDKIPFVSTVHNFDDFYNQYILTVFALRRLELALSASSMEEAAAYLTSIPLNIYAATIIIENEYFENYERLCGNLYICMESVWSPIDKIQWLVYLKEKRPNDQYLLKIAALYMEIQDYYNAYLSLKQIAVPSAETTALLSELKELFHYE